MSKKSLLAVAVGLLGVTTMATACKLKPDNGSSSDGGGKENVSQKQEYTLINGFENWDDLQELEINKTLFYGTLSVNRDAQYIGEGKASAKYEIDGVGANNPSFKMLASAKSDITDVSEFGLYIYNANNYPFSVIISALDGSDGIIYTQDAQAVAGANALSFAVNRQALQTTGSSVAKFQIAFNGVKADSVVYIDNFYAKLDDTKVELDASVKAVVSAIEGLNRNDRSAVEAVMAQYKALDVNKRKSVHNYNILKSAMDNFWLEDLTAARAQDPATLLFFDKPFAEVQVSSVSQSISACEYTTNFAYGDEAGSLKVSFTKSSVNWVTVDTTADVPVDDGYISLHIYNDSTQDKLVSLGWNGPKGASSSWEIKANSWLDIECPSTYLTANKGGIQIAGYDNGKGLAPEGTLYISAVRTFDYDRQYAELRVGDDANTLFFFDSEVGESQINPSEAGVTYGYTNTKSREGENGSMKLTFPGAAAQYSATYGIYGYPYTENDYAVFYVYNDTDCDFISLLFNYDNGVRLAKGEWTMVIRPVSEIANCYLRFMGQNYQEVYGVPTASQVQVNLSGSVYLSKAKVYSSDEIKALSHVAADAEWSIGDTTFVGPAQKYNGNPNALMNNPLEYEPYMVKEELRITLWAHDYAGFYGALKTPVDLSVENTYVAITLKGAKSDKFTILPLGLNGQYDAFGSSLYPMNIIEGENGYVTYVFKIAKIAGKVMGGLRVTPIGDTKFSVTVDGEKKDVPTAQATEIMISDIKIGNAEVMEDNNYFEGTLMSDRVGDDVNTLFFFDRAEGEKHVTQVGTAGTQYDYTTSKAYKSEAGSLKVSFPGTAAQNTLYYDIMEYAYADDDYAVFYIYNDTDCDFISLLFNYDNGVRLAKGEWTMVIRRVSEIADCYLRFMGQNYVAVNGVATASQSQVNLSGNVYISKAKVYSADEIVALERLGASAEWSIGDTAFVGAPQKYNGNQNALMNNPLEYEPYMVNGELRITLWAHDYAGFYATLKTPVDLSAESIYVAITLKGADADKFTILPMGTNGQYDAIGSALHPVNALEQDNGYVTYLFKIAKAAGKTFGGLRVTPIGDTKYQVTVNGENKVIPTAKATEIMIANVEIGNSDSMSGKNYFEGMQTLDRVGDDENTLFFFDRKLGEDHITEASAGVAYGYTAEKAYAGETGALKVTLPGNASHNTLKYDIMDYEYSAGDYAVFYVYNDTNTDFVQLMFDYNNSVFLEKGKWTAVVRPVSIVAEKYFRFFSMNNTDANGAPKDWSGASASGSLYISKVKVYSASAIANLTKVTGDWTVGNTTFTGTVKAYNNAISNTTYAGFLADDLQYAPYMLNGAMHMTLWEHSYAGFYATLKNAVDVSVETQYIAITAKGADAEKFTVLPLGANGEYDAFTSALKPVKTVAGDNDYVTYVFEVPVTAGRTICGLRVTPMGSTSGSWKAMNISISDVVIGGETVMLEKGYFSAV